MTSDSYFKLTDVHVDFPIYGVRSRSVSSMLRISTGGVINVGSDDRITVQALSGIDLHIAHGERIGLVGHNGAGKTTLLRVLASVYEPTRGVFEKRGRVSSLFDLTYGFDADADGLDNILIRGMYLGLTRAELLERQDAIASFSGLGGYLFMPVRTYSVGMLMRLAFAISTSVSPDILLMDEWLAVGDAEFIPRAERRLLDMIGNTQILIMASHSLGILERVCNRLVWLEAGRIRRDGPFKEVAAEFTRAMTAKAA